jgi:hypothetical protein
MKFKTILFLIKLNRICIWINDIFTACSSEAAENDLKY